MEYCAATYATDSTAWCTTAECCKENAHFPEDVQYCDDFYNPQVNAAFSMVSVDVWNGGQEGAAGMDKAVFNAQPPATINVTVQQAFSISNFQKASYPYQGVSSHGLAYGIGANSGFWKYFTTCPDGGLSAQCDDGFHCGPQQRRVMGSTMNHSEFQKQVNQIVEITGTAKCPIGSKAPSAYNEFDTNGLSSDDISGVIVAKGECGAARRPPPSQSSVCSFMAHANPNRKTPFPVYAYEPRASSAPASSSLRLQCYLNCQGATDIFI